MLKLLMIIILLSNQFCRINLIRKGQDTKHTKLRICSAMISYRLIIIYRYLFFFFHEYHVRKEVKKYHMSMKILWQLQGSSAFFLFLPSIRCCNMDPAEHNEFCYELGCNENHLNTNLEFSCRARYDAA